MSLYGDTRALSHTARSVFGRSLEGAAARHAPSVLTLTLEWKGRKWTRTSTLLSHHSFFSSISSTECLHPGINSIRHTQPTFCQELCHGITMHHFPHLQKFKVSLTTNAPWEWTACSLDWLFDLHISSPSSWCGLAFSFENAKCHSTSDGISNFPRPIAQIAQIF